MDLLSEPDTEGRMPSGVPAGFALRDLGVVSAEAGVTEEVEFVADEQTLALHLVAISHPGTFVVLQDARNPDGEQWVTPDPAAPVSPELDRYFGGFSGPVLSPNKVVARPRAAAALLPNTPALTIEPGPWTFRIGVYRSHFDESAERYDNEPLSAAVRVAILERRSAPPERGHIDLTFTFSTQPVGVGIGIDAAAAPDHPVFQQALTFVDDSLGRVGIRLGEVTYQDSSELEWDVDLGGPSCLGGPDVAQAFESAPPPKPGSLQVLMVDHFVCETPDGNVGGGLGAVSNGVPGLPFATRDGLIISTRWMNALPDLWQKMIAHEMGHFLGLVHTCEGDLGACDNIDDTPEGGRASANLMYPDLSKVTDFVFSPEQGEVMRLSPLLQPDW